MIKDSFKDKLEIYDTKFHTCFTEEAIKKVFKHYKINDFDPSVDCFDGFLLSGDGFLLIYIKDTKDYGTIAHEAYHLADRLCEQKGMEYKHNSGNEHVAYLVGYITERVIANGVKFEESKKKEDDRTKTKN